MTGSSCTALLPAVQLNHLDNTHKPLLPQPHHHNLAFPPKPLSRSYSHIASFSPPCFPHPQNLRCQHRAYVNANHQTAPSRSSATPSPSPHSYTSSSSAHSPTSPQQSAAQLPRRPHPTNTATPSTSRQPARRYRQAMERRIPSCSPACG